jgi:hypothetical protein
MNWGKITALILTVFVLFIGWMSYVMFRAPADDYDHQYYEDGLNFDHDYNREAQVVKDHAQPVILVNDTFIKFTFPQVVKGAVKFNRPASDAPDQAYLIDNRNGEPVLFPTKNIRKGKWQLIFEWKSNNKAYLYQQEIYIK